MGRIRWSVVPADIVAGRHLITILTALFMHASWSHIVGNMIFLWAFGPEIEDAMNPGRYAAFYLDRRNRLDARAGRRRSRLYDSQSGRERSDRRRDGRAFSSPSPATGFARCCHRLVRPRHVRAGRVVDRVLVSSSSFSASARSRMCNRAAWPMWLISPASSSAPPRRVCSRSAPDRRRAGRRSQVMVIG